MGYESTTQFEEKILSDNSKTNDFVLNKVWVVKNQHENKIS